MTVLELSRFYQVSSQSVYNWIYKYSNYQKQSIQVVEMKESSTQKIKDLELKIKELERVVGVKQINIDFLYIPLENSPLFQLKSIHPKNYKPTFGKTKRG